MCKVDYTKNVKLARLWSVITLKNRVQELRKQRRLSQSELADAVEVTRQTIISLENGKYNASLMLAHKIARYFDLTIEEVFLFEEDENKHEKEFEKSTERGTGGLADGHLVRLYRSRGRRGNSS